MTTRPSPRADALRRLAATLQAVARKAEDEKLRAQVRRTLGGQWWRLGSPPRLISPSD